MKTEEILARGGAFSDLEEEAMSMRRWRRYQMRWLSAGARLDRWSMCVSALPSSLLQV